MLNREIIYIILAAFCAFAAALLVGKLLIPALRALKAGQSIREIGPTWHNSKSGTPTMGGLIFMAGLLLIIPFGWRGMKSGDWTHLLVLAFSLVFGVIGFLDDFFKVKYKRNLGLTALQKLLLQLAASALYVYILYRLGELTCDLYVPFFNVSWHLPLAVYIALAMFIIVGCVNAVNLTDGIDGLAAGVTIPVMLFFTVACIAAKKLTLGVGSLSDFSLLPGKTALCVGTTDTIRTSASGAVGSPIYYTWSSSDPSVDPFGHFAGGLFQADPRQAHLPHDPHPSSF